MKTRPFQDGDTFATFRNVVEKVTAEIQSLDNEYFLKASQSEPEQHCLEAVHIEPLVLHADKHYIVEQAGTDIDVSHDFTRAVFPGKRAIVRGTKMDIAVPYEGDAFLWRICPSTHFLTGYPEIDVREDVIVLTFSFPDDRADAESLKAEINREMGLLGEMAQNLRRDVENHNHTAPDKVRSALERKRKSALSVMDTVSNLGIPVKRRGEPPTFAIPAKRRRPPSTLPSVATERYAPEPVLEEQEYEHILEIIRSMSVVIERSPSSFATLNEETIRDHFLLQLNGHYEGGATGETFNASGKTDILIRVDDRNVFIAECKFWKGRKAFNEAVDQLLGYLSWRDSKCALLVFNRTKDSTAVRLTMHEVMEGRSEHRKTIRHDPEGDSIYVLVKQSDPGREITITTQLYDVPAE